MAEQVKFSIFDPVIAYDHREFYEQIVNELNVILPVCNQGKCLAVEISRNPAEQETIRELMQRVERFRGELLEGTKKLFDQFYQSKESFHKMIQSTVAYVKINLIDRNLLERTCDVRWWALETAFCGCIEEFNSVRDALGNLRVLLVEHRQRLQERRQALTEGGLRSALLRLLTGNASPSAGGKSGMLARKIALIDQTLPLLEGVGALVSGQQYEIFSKAAEELTGVLETEGEEWNIREMCHRVRERANLLRPMIDYACDRLQTINASYTLYRDLVICDAQGYVIANSNAPERARVLGLRIQHEEWFGKALATASGTEYFAQDLAPSLVEAQPSLVYSTAIRKDGRETNPPIGAMGVFFDFQGEAGIILGDYMPGNKDGGIKDGWCSFFTNQRDEVIASSDPAAFTPGTLPLLPRSHRNLKPGQIRSSYGIFAAEEAALFSARTDGYLDYAGLGWSSHLVLPRRDIFRRSSLGDAANVDIGELLGSRIIPEINKSTHANVQKDKRALQLISTNGMLFAAELGIRGQALSPVFEQITRTGDFATSCMEDLLREMAADSLNLNFQTLRLFSKQAIDLMDRNLFERAADIRWWATDRYFWDALAAGSDEKYQQASERMKVINNSYTMYRNIVLADATGRIVACSRPAVFNQIRGINVSGHDWFQQGIQTRGVSDYAVQDVCFSDLEPGKKTSLVYAGGVRAKGAKEADAIGVLGIFFDWDTEAKKMLEKCLPRDSEGASIAGSAAFYTDREGRIIETTNAEVFPVGRQNERLAEICAGLTPGSATAGIFEWANERYIIGSARTKGYREYSGLSWTAHVLRPF